MIYAFARDGAVPGHRLLHRINIRTGTPTNSIWFAVCFAFVLGLPSLVTNRSGVPVAFAGIVSVAVAAQTIAFTLPVLLRRLRGKDFERGPWHLGRLRDADLLMNSFPDPQQRQMRLQLRRQVDCAIAVEWPAMARGAANLSVVPAELVKAQRLALTLPTATDGQRLAQSTLVDAIDAALQARRARISLSTSAIDPIRLAAVVLVAVVTLAAAACVHAARLRTAALALALFATSMAAVLTLLIADAGPFSGHFGIRPVLLEKVRPQP